jgi:hypothetical protein
MAEVQRRRAVRGFVAPAVKRVHHAVRALVARRSPGVPDSSVERGPPHALASIVTTDRRGGQASALPRAARTGGGAPAARSRRCSCARSARPSGRGARSTLRRGRSAARRADETTPPGRARTMLEIAIQRHPRSAPAGGVEGDRRQSPQRVELDGLRSATTWRPVA